MNFKNPDLKTSCIHFLRVDSFVWDKSREPWFEFIIFKLSYGQLLCVAMFVLVPSLTLGNTIMYRLVTQKTHSKHLNSHSWFLCTLQCLETSQNLSNVLDFWDFILLLSLPYQLHLLSGIIYIKIGKVRFLFKGRFGNDYIPVTVFCFFVILKAK